MMGGSGVHWSANAGVFGEPLGKAQAGDEGYGAAARFSDTPAVMLGRIVHFGLAEMWDKPTDDNSTNVTGPKFATVRFRNKPEFNVLA
jgi:hypothetical protein